MENTNASANPSSISPSSSTSTDESCGVQELRSKSLTSIASIGFPQRDSVSEESVKSPTDGLVKDTGITNSNALDDDSGSDFICVESESQIVPKDFICLLVVCEKHQAVALKMIVNDCYYLPAFQFYAEGQSLSETLRSVLAMHDANLLNDDSPYVPRLRLVDLYRVQLFKTRNFVQRYVFQIIMCKKDASTLSEQSSSIEEKVDPDAPCFCGGSKVAEMECQLTTLYNQTNSEDTVWIPIRSIPNNLSNIWGGELQKLHYYTSIQQQQPLCKPVSSYPFTLTELDCNHPRVVLDRKDWLKDMLDSIRTNFVSFDAATYYLYNEFVVQCFPSSTMSFTSYCIMLDKLGLLFGNSNIESRKRMFRSMDRQYRQFLDFEDLCLGMVIFETNNEVNDLAHRQDYIFRFYDSNADQKLELDEYKQLINDYFNQNSIDELLKQDNKTRLSYIQEVIDYTWKSFVCSNNSSSEQQQVNVDLMSFEQYLKAFEWINKSVCANRWWFNTVSFFDPIHAKFNCRSIAITPVQQVVDETLSFSRCEMCSNRNFSLSSNLVELSEVGNIVKIFRLKPTAPPEQSAAIQFVDELQEKNIYRLANEFLIRIEKIGYSLMETNSGVPDQAEEDAAKNYFFPTRHKMLKYLHLILAFAKPLIENDPRIIELTTPCYVFGDLNGSLRDLLRFGQTIFRTHPFVDPASLLFLGSYTDADSAYNLECLIYLVCMKILSPTRVFLLRGTGELAGRQQIQMQDQEKSTEPLNDIICDLLAQIFDSFPIASIIEDSIYASHSGIPKDFALSRMKLICQYNHKGCGTAITAINLDDEQQLQYNPYIWLRPITDKNAIALLEDLMDELLLKVITGELVECESKTESQSLENSQESFTNRDFELFISVNKLFCAVRSHQEFHEDGFQLNTNFNLATIVSSTKGARVPTCLYIDYKRVRLIRFDPNF